MPKPKKQVPDGSPQTTDPVCGMEVDSHATDFSHEHHGETFYFCSAGCKEKFMKDPHQYMSHPMDADRMHPGSIKLPEKETESGEVSDTCPMQKQIAFSAMNGILQGPLAQSAFSFASAESRETVLPRNFP